MSNNYHYLSICALGPDQPGIVRAIGGAAMDAGCNILDSHMTALGSEFAVLVLAHGNWNTLTRLEKALDKLSSDLDLKIICKPTEEAAGAGELLPYAVDVVSLDHPGIVYNLADFFSSRKINISDMVTSGYSAAHTGTRMFALHMTIHIPAETQISQLREEFMDCCDELNLDAVIEPHKT